MKAGILLVSSLALNCSGCASIMCSAEKTINISSEPPGAQFEVVAPSGKVVTQGMTPANVTLRRGRGYFQAGDYVAKFSKSGYEDTTVSVEQGFETGWYFFGNFLIGPLSSVVGGLIVDPLTGAMWDIRDVHVSLRLPGEAEPIEIPKKKPDYRIKRSLS